MDTLHLKRAQKLIARAALTILLTVSASCAVAAKSLSCAMMFGGAARSLFTAPEQGENNLRLQRIHSSLARAAVEKDAHFLKLQEWGLHLSTSGHYELGMQVAIEKVSAEIHEAIREGKIGAEQALFPARVYAKIGVSMSRATTADLHFASARDAIPEGYEMFNGLLPLKLFYEVLSLGHFPVSAPHQVLVQGLNVEEGAYLHDLNHLSAMTSDFTYMSQLRATAQTLLRESNPGGASRPDKTEAYEYFSEFLTVIHPALRPMAMEKIVAIKNQLGLQGIDVGSFEKIGQFSTPIGQYKIKILEKIKSADANLVQQILDLHALASRPGFWVPYGGAVRAIEQRFGSDQAFAKLEVFAPMMTRDRPDLVLGVQSRLKSWDPTSDAGLRSAISFFVRMEQLSSVTKDSIFHALFSSSAKDAAELRRLCKGGFFADAICRGVESGR